MNAFCATGLKEPGDGENEHRQLPSCYNSSHQETRSEVSAGLQCTEWNCKYELTGLSLHGHYSV